MDKDEKITYSIIAGIIITLISIMNPIRGAPWPWIINNRIVFQTMIIDIFVWSIVVYIGYEIFERTAK